MDNTERRVRGHERWWWVVAIAAFAAALFLTQGQCFITAAGHAMSSVAAVETSGDDDQDGEEIGRC